jgi:hypothetical protein
MVKSLSRIVLGLAVLALLVPAYSFAGGQHAGKVSQTDLRMALRDLWSGHIFWVRNVVVETKYGDTGAAKVSEDYAVRNAKDIANAFVPYYGKEASDRLFHLLAGHYGAVKDYMGSTFSGNKEGKTSAVDKLNKNADEIATFLSSANPNWPKGTMLSALAAHGGHHLAQIDAIQAKDFAGEARIWEEMKKHIYVIADVLAEGIGKQFAPKF